MLGLLGMAARTTPRGRAVHTCHVLREDICSQARALRRKAQVGFGPAGLRGGGEAGCRYRYRYGAAGGCQAGQHVRAPNVGIWQHARVG